MALYTVYGQVTVTCYVKVDADSPEEALEKARQIDDPFETDQDGEPEWKDARETRW